jgi:hypothetical protein
MSNLEAGICLEIFFRSSKGDIHSNLWAPVETFASVTQNRRTAVTANASGTFRPHCFHESQPLFDCSRNLRGRV